MAQVYEHSGLSPRARVGLLALSAVTLVAVTYWWSAQSPFTESTISESVQPSPLGEDVRGSEDSPYVRSENEQNYYGYCEASPTRMHEWRNGAGWMKRSYYARPVWDESISLCKYCGAFIA